MSDLNIAGGKNVVLVRINVPGTKPGTVEPKYLIVDSDDADVVRLALSGTGYDGIDPVLPQPHFATAELVTLDQLQTAMEEERAKIKRISEQFRHPAQLRAD